MKIKTDKDRSFMEFLCGQMDGISGLEAKRMFGAYGLYSDNVFFGIVYQGMLFLKTDEESRKRYIQRGMEALHVSEKQKMGNYFQVPVDVIEDEELLMDWAAESVRVSKAIKSKKRR